MKRAINILCDLLFVVKKKINCAGLCLRFSRETFFHGQQVSSTTNLKR